MEILALIPARSGSKGVPRKNIRMVAGKPMLAYPIEQALSSKLITRAVVSTDSEEYMEIARRHGASTPFRRPAEFAGDDSLDIDVFFHALSWLRDNEGYVPDICVQLRPCSPVRDVSIVDRIIQALIDNPQWDSVRAVSRSTENPYKMWHMADDGTLSPLIGGFPECYNMLRQQLPVTFLQNGYVDAMRPRVVLEQRSMTGNVIGGFIVDEYFDVDHPGDLDLVEACAHIRAGRRVFLIDAEGCLLDADGGFVETNAQIVKRIKAAGHTVFVRCPRAREEVCAWLESLGVDDIVTDYAQADYHISAKNISMSDLGKIVGS